MATPSAPPLSLLHSSPGSAKLTASMLFARAHNLEHLHTNGNGLSPWKCHWCGAPCDNKFPHDDPPPVPFTRSKSTAKFPGESYCCRGCVAWRWPKRTIDFLASGQKDGQQAKNYSWYITDQAAYGLRNRQDFEMLWDRLLQPPKRFVLTLKAFGDGCENLLQLALINDPGGIIASTPLYFTLSNIEHNYSVYELEEALRNGPNAYGPGIRALWKFLGDPPEALKKRYPSVREEENRRGRGRPQPIKDSKYTTMKVILASGSAA